VKSAYSQFCSGQFVPFHLQPWWLDAVCGPDHWNVSLATDQGGGVTGALPYYQTRKYGLPVVVQPPFTSYGGPWLRYPHNPDFKRASRYAFEKKVYTELIGGLPRVAWFNQNFRPEITNHLPFHWAGFRQTTRYTYWFEDVSNLDGIVAGFKNTLRTDLIKADMATYITREEDRPDLVFDLNRQSFSRKGLTHPYKRTIFDRLHMALLERRQAACFIARSREDNSPHAALYLVFDDRQAAVLLTGVAREHKSSCAIYGLFLEAIRFCSQHSLSLDFEGSMDPGIEHTFRAFGAEMRAYHRVWKTGF
jgi:hypothetical protein